MNPTGALPSSFAPNLIKNGAELKSNLGYSGCDRGPLRFSPSPVDLGWSHLGNIFLRGSKSRKSYTSIDRAAKTHISDMVFVFHGGRIRSASGRDLLLPAFLAGLKCAIIRII